MRPGRKGPRYACFWRRSRGAPIRFNEAGAQRPQILRDVCSALTRYAGFNEAGAQRPQICAHLFQLTRHEYVLQ